MKFDQPAAERGIAPMTAADVVHKPWQRYPSGDRYTQATGRQRLQTGTAAYLATVSRIALHDCRIARRVEPGWNPGRDHQDQEDAMEHIEVLVLKSRDEYGAQP